MIDLTDGLKLSLWVQGRPRTKGSLKCLGARTKGGRHALVEDHALSAPWRARMNNAIVREVRAAYPGEWTPYAGPLAVRATFYFERLGPAGGASALSAWPTVNAGIYANGDLDKLERNLLDALEGSGLITNDCNVVTMESRKTWAAPGLPAGVQIEVVSL